jgi:hypothetical protein
MPDVPVACSLDAASLAARRAGLVSELARTASSRIELDAGQRLTFAPSSTTLAVIAHVIDAERQCCRFLTFHLTVEPDLGAFVLDLTGPPGTREFLADLLRVDARSA